MSLTALVEKSLAGHLSLLTTLASDMVSPETKPVLKGETTKGTLRKLFLRGGPRRRFDVGCTQSLQRQCHQISRCSRVA